MYDVTSLLLKHVTHRGKRIWICVVIIGILQPQDHVFESLVLIDLLNEHLPDRSFHTAGSLYLDALIPASYHKF